MDLIFKLSNIELTAPSLTLDQTFVKLKFDLKLNFFFFKK